MEFIDVTAAVIRKNGKVLIAQRAKGEHLEGLWKFPGGKIEKGETPEEYLKRELFEEFGINIRITDEKIIPVIYNCVFNVFCCFRFCCGV